MKKKNNQEINFASRKDHKSKPTKKQKGMPTIKCVCNARILVVPDLRAMNKAIKNHVAEHKKTCKDPKRLDFFEKSLTEQVLIAASKMNPPNAS
jgi:hypothetical protein